MNIKINANILRDGLNKVLTVIDKKNARPILSNCLINCLENSIEIIATDLEVTAKILLDAQTNSKGSFCINTKNFFDIVRELPENEIDLNINQDKNLLELICGKINYSLLISNNEEYPQVNFSNSGNQFKLLSSDLIDIISKISHAISNDETRINLNGIFLQQIDSKLRGVAIDGHRFALLDISNFESDNQNLIDGVIIPKKGVLEIKKIAEAYPNDALTVSIDDSFISINADNKYQVSIRLIAREYPKYQTVIPSKTKSQMVVEKTTLLNSVRRIKILSNEKTNGIKLSLSKNQLILSANHPSLGHATETIQVNYNGDEIEIGFNAKYMLESLMVLDVDEVVYEFNNELSPVIFRSEAIQNFLGIIMPLKL